MGNENMKGPSIGKRIREIRHKLGKTQAEFGYMIGVQQSQIATWEKGTTTKKEHGKTFEKECRPSLDYLVQIAKLGNKSLDWLVTGENFNDGPTNSDFLYDMPIADALKALMYFDMLFTSKIFPLTPTDSKELNAKSITETQDLPNDSHNALHVFPLTITLEGPNNKYSSNPKYQKLATQIACFIRMQHEIINSNIPSSLTGFVIGLLACSVASGKEDLTSPNAGLSLLTTLETKK